MDTLIRQCLSEDSSTRLFLDSAYGEQLVECRLNIKESCLIAGMPYFVRVFEILGGSDFQSRPLLELEGRELPAGSHVEFKLPFRVAIKGERLALNLLRRSSSVASATKKLAARLPPEISLLDTRKTTPGLRDLEKYSVCIGGGKSHRYDQQDALMIKDNHKACYGGLELAVDHFLKFKGFYTPVIVEIHSLEELKSAQKMNLKHVMLDNFTAEEIVCAVEQKWDGVTYEVSGGITPANIDQFAIVGVDAISTSFMTQNPAPLDFSLKIRPSE